MVHPPAEAAAGEVVDEGGSIGVRVLVVAAGAGLAGMVAMAPLLALAWAVDALEPSAFASLATVVGLGPSFPLGFGLFVAGGMTTLPLLFVSLAIFLPGRTTGQKGAVFAAIVWSGFAIAFYSRQAGALLVVFLLVTFLAHLVYGYVLGRLYGRVAPIPEYQV